MAICSYLIVPAPGATEPLARRLAAMPGCDVVRAENRDVLILVTDTPDREAEDALRRELESMDEVAALVLTFGEIENVPPNLDVP